MTFFLNLFPPISCWSVFAGSKYQRTWHAFPNLRSTNHDATGDGWVWSDARKLQPDYPQESISFIQRHSWIPNAKTSHLSNSTVSSITERCHTNPTIVSIINCVNYSFCSKENLKSITIGYFIENINSFRVKFGLVNSLLPQTNKITRMQKS